MSEAGKWPGAAAKVILQGMDPVCPTAPPAPPDIERHSMVPLGVSGPVSAGVPLRSRTLALSEAILSAGRLPSVVARRAACDLDRLELAESTYSSARATKKGLAWLSGGFAFAIFPFTPGLVLNCKPSHNPGWQCGARAAAFLASCEAALTCLFTGVAIWRERGVLAQRAAAMGLALQRDAIRHGGQLPSPAFFAAYLGADAAGRQRVRDSLEDASAMV